MKAKRKLEIRIPGDLNVDYTIAIPKGGNAGQDSQSAGDLVISLKLK